MTTKILEADYRGDGEPGCEITVSAKEKRVFNTIAEGAEWLGVDPDVLVEMIENHNKKN